jgi:hypothetical protein
MFFEITTFEHDFVHGLYRLLLIKFWNPPPPFFFNNGFIILELSSICTSMCLYVLLNSSVCHTQLANRVGVGFLALFSFH